jgi:hypothetical protein
MLEFVEATDRSIGVGLTPHFDETEALPAACLTISDDLDALNFAELRKQLFKVGTADVVAEVADVELLPHVKTPGRVRDDPGLPSGSELKGTDMTLHQAGRRER